MNFCKKFIILFLFVFIMLNLPASLPYASDICCLKLQGNFNGDSLDVIDIADIVYMVNYQFNGGDSLVCFEEGDIYPVGNPDNSIDIADLVAMVAFQFNDGEAPGFCPYHIEFRNLNPDDEQVSGYANVDDTALYKVVLWAKTDRWYIQPQISAPYTDIETNGLWSNQTNAWTRLIALLVDTTYTPGTVQEEHPSSNNGVVNWTEYPEKSPDKFLEWSGYTWRVKQAENAGPGPNFFSDDSVNVWVDLDDQLHVQVRFEDNIWKCSEVALNQSLGFGLYTFKVNSRIDNLDYNTIFAGFIYDTSSQEFDFEFSQRLADPYNSQTVVQPWYIPGNIVFYDLPPITLTSHSFEWRADSIVFKSWAGHEDTATGATLLHNWTYNGADIPVESTEKMIFNLYLFGGEAPISGFGDEVVLKTFQYTK